MTGIDPRTDVRTAVLTAIEDVAPDAEVDTLDPSADLREEIDIDSMDFLQILERIEKTLGVSVPEKDYGKVASLDALVDYVASRTGHDGT